MLAFPNHVILKVRWTLSETAVEPQFQMHNLDETSTARGNGQDIHTYSCVHNVALQVITHSQYMYPPTMLYYALDKPNI